MVMIISYIIAVILTVIIACTIYPIAGLFFVIDKIGNVIGWISKKAFAVANGAVSYLWKDLSRTKIVRNDMDNMVIYNNQSSDNIEDKTEENNG